MDSNEPESARLDREIAALLQKKAAAQAKEEQRAEVENARRANILVENSPVKNKTPAPHHAAVHEKPTIRQPVFTANRLTTTHPQAGPSRPDSRSSPSVSTPTSSVPSRLSSALLRARQNDASGDTDDLDGDGTVKPGKRRDDMDMTVIESLTLGPKDYGLDTMGTEEWRWTEPNSGINLKERLMSHSQVQNQLADRYVLSPSQIYSIMRLSTDKQHYTIPVDAGWAVIGVVCHKGEIKMTQGKRKEDTGNKGKGRASDEDLDVDDDDRAAGDLKRQKNGPGAGEWTNKNATSKSAPASKFITIKICSLPSRSQLSGTAAASQGDAIMNVMLFESDSDETLPSTVPGETGQKRYRGGSGGAFEVWWKLALGAVVGIISPKILKPFGGGNKGPHPLTHPVGLTPSSADDIFLIGRAKDLGTCASIKRDGKQCTEWVDLRVHQHCEYHVVGAIKQIRGGRAEFAGSTGGFQLAMKAAAPMYSRGKIGKDNGKEWKTRPTNQILPKRGFDDGTGQTYIVGGRAVSERKSQKFADEHVAERMGREKQTNLRRKNEAAAREKELANLMGSDNGTTGAKYLEAANKLRREDEQKDKKETAKKALEQGLGDTLKPRPFHASAIKLIGFDPTTAQNEGGLMVEKGEEGRRRLEAIASLRSKARPAARLGNMAGSKSKSNASVPLGRRPQPPKPTDQPIEEPMIDLTDSDGD